MPARDPLFPHPAQPPLLPAPKRLSAAQRKALESVKDGDWVWNHNYPIWKKLEWMGLVERGVHRGEFRYIRETATGRALRLGV